MSSQRMKPKLPITPKSVKMNNNRPVHNNQNSSRNVSSSRKPRLNITSSQTPPKRQKITNVADSFNNTVSPPSMPSTQNWGLDDDEDDLLLASVNLEPEQPTTSFKENEGPSKLTRSVQPTSNYVSRPPIQSISRNIPASNTRTFFKPQPSAPSNSSRAMVGQAGASSEATKSMELLVQQLKSELTVRDGETKNLRLELQKKEKLMFEMKNKLEEEKQAALLEVEKKYSKIKKELEQKNTELQFQSRNIVDSEEKMKAMRSLMRTSPPNKQAQNLNSSRALFNDDLHKLEAQIKDISPKKKEPQIELYEPLNIQIHAGKLLYERLHPRLFDPPAQENETLVEKAETTKSVNVSTVKSVLLTQTVAKLENNEGKYKNQQKADSSNKSPQLMSFSPMPFIPFYTMESLNTESASEPVRKIFLKCWKQLEKFLIMLEHAAKFDESYEKRVGKLAISCFSVAVSRDEDCLFLLSSEQWYPDERGIEIRRSITVLSELADISVHAVNLLLQTNFTENECDPSNPFRRSSNKSDDKLISECTAGKKRKPSTSLSPERSKFPKVNHMEPSTSRMEIDPPKSVSPSSKKGGSFETVPTQTLREEGRKIMGPLEKLDFLQVILDIVSEICNQFRTLSFNGVLAAVICLLKTLAKLDCDIPIERLNVINNIVKQVVFCCPGPAVIHDIISLMVPLAKYLTCTNSLCNNSSSITPPERETPESQRPFSNSNDFDPPVHVQESFIEASRHYTFTTDTCVLQVLCTECEMIDKTPKFAEDFTKWALKVTVDTSDCPNWLAGDCRMVTCDCFPRFIQLFLNVLHYAVLTYADEERPICQLSRNQLESVMKRGIIILNRIILQRNDFLTQVGSWDGLYEAIIHHLLRISKTMQFEPPIYEMLTNLIHTSSPFASMSPKIQNSSDFFEPKSEPKPSDSQIHAVLNLSQMRSKPTPWSTHGLFHR
nr:PREDICTED: uncharacterized protein LOC109029883 isoform X2 [Bemisia tabaci]